MNAKPAPDVRVPLLIYHDAQQDVVDSISVGRSRGINTYVVEAGRRTGKTALARDLCIRAILNGEKAGYWVPTYPDGKGTWSWFVNALGGVDSPLVKVMNRTLRRIELTTGGELDMWALDKDGSGRGFDYDIAVIEEAAKAKNLASAIDETIDATLLDRSGYMLIISTPRGRNYFHRLYIAGQKPNPDILSFRIPSYANPYIDRDNLLATKRKLVARGRRWVWDQEYLARPADQGVNPFDEKIIEDQLQQEPTGKPVVAYGLDLAKQADYCVLIGLDKDRKIASFARWNKIPWPDTEDKIAGIVADYPDADILVDSTGVGDPVYDHLLDRGLRVERFVFTARSREQLLDKYAIDMSEGLAYVLAGQHYTEMSSAEYVERNGRLKVVVPEPEHDDCMMAGALANKMADDLGYPLLVSSITNKTYRTGTRRSVGRLNKLRGLS